MEKVVLITGAARRIGACIAKTFHANGYRVIIHYSQSKQAGLDLVNELNQIRTNSATGIQADLTIPENWKTLVKKSIDAWGRVDVFVHNASTFYPTILGQVTEGQWDDLMHTNLKSAFFISQGLFEELKKNQGVIINITDVHAEKPLRNYTVYSIAKAGLEMLTKALAKEMAPNVRVNAVAPGNILWPEGENILTDEIKNQILNKIPLERQGTPHEIADAVYFLANSARYVTGEILTVDGGRSIV